MKKRWDYLGKVFRVKRWYKRDVWIIIILKEWMMGIRSYEEIINEECLEVRENIEEVIFMKVSYFNSW